MKAIKKCKNIFCDRVLYNVSDSRKFCDNNNKCKNDFHNALRKEKAEFADKIVQLHLMSQEYQRRIEIILKNRKIKILPMDEFDLMGVDLTSEIFELKYVSEDMTYFEFRFEDYVIYSWFMEGEVAICRRGAA